MFLDPFTGECICYHSLAVKVNICYLYLIIPWLVLEQPLPSNIVCIIVNHPLEPRHTPPHVKLFSECLLLYSKALLGKQRKKVFISFRILEAHSLSVRHTPLVGHRMGAGPSDQIWLGKNFLGVFTYTYVPTPTT
jgi:hypothetical protein